MTILFWVNVFVFNKKQEQFVDMELVYDALDQNLSFCVFTDN